MLCENTPTSIQSKVSNIENEVLQDALLQRQVDIEKAEAEEVKKQLLLDSQQNATEKNASTTSTEKARVKKRLVAFYEKNAPDKVHSVDDTLKRFAGKEAVLFDMLRTKYGKDSLPDYHSAIMMKDRAAEKTEKMGKFFSSFSKSVTKKMEVVFTASKEDNVVNEGGGGGARVSFTLTADEILPSVAGQAKKTKQAKAKTGLKYFLIDVREQENGQCQGKFPTSIRIPNKTLLDPEKMCEEMELFESLRGTVHICIMGEGLGLIPKRYGVPLSSHAKKKASTDECVTEMCALFFIKKGFPFVSVLEDGFGAAHAWLINQGPRWNVGVECLEDYDEEESLWMKYEMSYMAKKEIALFPGAGAGARAGARAGAGAREEGEGVAASMNSWAKKVAVSSKSFATKLDIGSGRESSKNKISNNGKEGGMGKAEIIDSIVTVSFPSSSIFDCNNDDNNDNGGDCARNSNSSSSSSSSNEEEAAEKTNKKKYINGETKKRGSGGNKFFTYVESAATPPPPPPPTTTTTTEVKQIATAMLAAAAAATGADFDIGDLSDDDE